MVDEARKAEILSVMRSAAPEPEGSVSMETTLADMGYDSLDMLAVVDAVENHFEVKIPDEKFSEIDTLGDLMNAIEDALRAK